MTGLAEQTVALLGRRSVLATVLPTACWSAAVALVFIMAVGVGETVEAWERQDDLVRGGIVMVSAAAVGGLALVISSQTFWLVRLFEGYVGMPGALKTKAVAWHETRRQSLSRLDPQYPMLRSGAPLPTRLGNVMRAGEMYPHERYGIDAVTMWPRLYPLLPEATLAPLTTARAGLEQMVVLSILSLTFGVVAGTGLVVLNVGQVADVALWAPAGVVIGGWAACVVCYRSAVAYASAFATCLRAAFDLHRFELLIAMHVPIPANRSSEHKVWEHLHQVVAGGRPPDATADPAYATPAGDREGP